jgi:phosphoglycerate dehydrogenase-like enzyme
MVTISGFQSPENTSDELHGKTMGIIGLGQLGRHVADIAEKLKTLYVGVSNSAAK